MIDQGRILHGKNANSRHVHQSGSSPLLVQIQTRESCGQHTLTQQLETSLPIRLSLDQLQTIHLPFSPAILDPKTHLLAPESGTCLDPNHAPSGGIADGPGALAGRIASTKPRNRRFQWFSLAFQTHRKQLNFTKIVGTSRTQPEQRARGSRLGS